MIYLVANVLNTLNIVREHISRFFRDFSSLNIKMSDDETRDKWNEFVEIGNTIHKMKGQVRILEAKRALRIANQLIENDLILNLPTNDTRLFSSK